MRKGGYEPWVAAMARGRKAGYHGLLRWQKGRKAGHHGLLRRQEGRKVGYHQEEVEFFYNPCKEPSRYQTSGAALFYFPHP